MQIVKSGIDRKIILPATQGQTTLSLRHIMPDNTDNASTFDLSEVTAMTAFDTDKKYYEGTFNSTVLGKHKILSTDGLVHQVIMVTDQDLDSIASLIQTVDDNVDTLLANVATVDTVVDGIATDLDSLQTDVTAIKNSQETSHVEFL